MTVCQVCGKPHNNFKYLDGLWVCESCLGYKLRNHEFIPERIRDERKQYAKSLIQPWRDGVASKEYAEAYPDKAKKMFKDEKPKEVWKDILPPDWKKSS